jgi:hypothetical protein
MFLSARNRTDILRRAFVIAVVVCLFVFAIYLKAGAPYAGGNATSQTRMWADPSEKSGTHTKIAPLTLLVLLFVAVCFCKTEKPGAPVKLAEPACKDIFFQSLHWFRPPPARLPLSATV